jgi:hypothetical protein
MGRGPTAAARWWLVAGGWSDTGLLDSGGVGVV